MQGLGEVFFSMIGIGIRYLFDRLNNDYNFNDSYTCSTLKNPFIIEFFFRKYLIRVSSNGGKRFNMPLSKKFIPSIIEHEHR